MDLWDGNLTVSMVAGTEGENRIAVVTVLHDEGTSLPMRIRGLPGRANFLLPQLAMDAASVAEILAIWLVTVCRIVRFGWTIETAPLGLPLTT